MSHGTQSGDLSHHLHMKLSLACNAVHASWRSLQLMQHPLPYFNMLRFIYSESFNSLNEIEWHKCYYWKRHTSYCDARLFILHGFHLFTCIPFLLSYCPLFQVNRNFSFTDTYIHNICEMSFSVIIAYVYLSWITI